MMLSHRVTILFILGLSGAMAFAPSLPLRSQHCFSGPAFRALPAAFARPGAAVQRAAAPLGLTAGLDPGTPLPNLDALYFSGCLAAVVCAGALQFNSMSGNAGLGKYLSQGPEDKNWESRQAKASNEDRKQKNEAASGGWLASILPKLDFVEVYGREEEAPPPIEIEVPEGMGQGEAIQELSKELNAAVARGDGRVAAAIKNKIQELGRPRE